MATATHHPDFGGTPVHIGTYRRFLTGVRAVILVHVMLGTAVGSVLLFHFSWFFAVLFALIVGFVGASAIANHEPLPTEHPGGE